MNLVKITKTILVILVFLTTINNIYSETDFTTIHKEKYDKSLDLNYEIYKSLNLTFEYDNLEFEDLEVLKIDEKAINLKYSVPIKIKLKITKNGKEIIKQFNTTILLNDIYLNEEEQTKPINPENPEDEKKQIDSKDKILSSGGGGGVGSSGGNSFSEGTYSFSKPIGGNYIDESNNKKKSEKNINDIKTINQNENQNNNQENKKIQPIIQTNQINENLKKTPMFYEIFFYLVCGIVAIYSIIKKKYLIIFGAFKKRKKREAVPTFVEYEDIYR